MVFLTMTYAGEFRIVLMKKDLSKSKLVVGNPFFCANTQRTINAVRMYIAAGIEQEIVEPAFLVF